MTCMTKQCLFAWGVTALLATVSPSLAEAQVPLAEQSERRIDPKADQVLRAMAEFYKNLKSASVEVTTRYDGQLGRHVERLMTNEMTFTVSVERPHRFASGSVRAKRPLQPRSSAMAPRPMPILPYFGGHQVVNGPVEQSRVFPGRRPEGAAAFDCWFLLDKDPYELLTRLLISGQYIASEKIGGIDYHHLRFSETGAMFAQKEVTWEIWVQSGATPLVYRVVIVPGEARIKHTEPPIIFETLEKITHTFANWKTDGALPPDTFAIPKQ